MLTFEISLDMVNGGTFLEVPDITKWSLWMTYLAFTIGLFSSAPCPKLEENKNDPLMSWKWFTVVFEIALLF